MKKRTQTNISTILVITAIVAFWLGMHRVAPNTSWLVVGIVMIGSYSIYVRNLSRFFWMPFILCVSWSTLSLMSWWTAPSEIVFLVGLALLSINAIITIAIIRTRRIALNRETRDGVIFVGWAQSSLVGLCVGLSISLPILVAGIFPSAPIPHFFARLELIIALPFVGLFIGMALGVVLGFVCDVVVGLDFKKRSQNPSAG